MVGFGVTGVAQFITALAKEADRPGFYINPYRRPDALQNLRVYLEHFAGRPVPLLLVGEAPGYRGCALTGIPFSSPHLLGSRPFFSQLNPALPPGPRPKEPTATIVWQVFRQLEIRPLCWNAFPFHPHQAGKPSTNRRPGRAELDRGRLFLAELINLFQPEKIGAVGRTAERQLRILGLPHTYLRHPSYGGKKGFTLGLKNLSLLITN